MLFLKNLIKLSLIGFLVLLINIGLAYGSAVQSNIPTLETSAVSAVLMDENGQVLFAKEPHKSLPPASVTKIMTLLLAVEAVENGQIKLTDEVTVSTAAWRQGGSQIWLEPGEKMSVREMMTAVAVVSANDAAVAIMEHLFGDNENAVQAMNDRAKQLGLQNTHYANVNGLPAPEHYMSAYDTALIVKEAVKHPLYMELCNIKEYWLRGGKNWLVNTNKLLWWYPGADGLKTGWTEEAKYCFAGTAKRDGLRLISIVYATPEPRSHLRESMKILDWGFKNFAAVPIVKKGDKVDKIVVNKGVKKEVSLIAGADLTLVISKGKQKNIQKKYEIERERIAPVQAGEKCGELIVLQEGIKVGSIDLVAESTVEKAKLLHIFSQMVEQLFGY